ncbi:YwmB family TATA-box binding protein [Alkalibacillus aidingensis]|uniref:YwmB family TATA-box binding protein n=1 Tax=Alkalibacillus aidingensis TaxID=2747607 RepID=UPI0016603685|nr:YwmB family TATA-box binding protein [Alkalibacillus aidingensis]
MRLVYSVMTFILLFQSLVYQSISFNSVESFEFNDFDELAQYVLDQDLDATTFQITMKVNLPEDEANALVADLKKVSNNYKKDPQKSIPFSESFSVIDLDHHKNKQVVYDIVGDEWNQTIYQQVKDYLSHSNFQTFSENGEVYSCFQSEIDGMINSNLFKKEFLQDFAVELNNILVEDNFTVLSGYSEQMTNYIPLDQSKMNIQMAIREQDVEKNVVTIGTPILVIEY